jgi:hypothetical protein
MPVMEFTEQENIQPSGFGIQDHRKGNAEMKVLIGQYMPVIGIEYVIEDECTR